MVGYFVDVWSGSLAQDAENLQVLEAFLSAGERQKAQEFRLPVMKNRYIATRGLLRQTLAGYLLSDPAGLHFDIGEYGKPCLVCGSLHFNVSHSGDQLLIAVANFPDIGIDIEVVKSRDSLDSLAERCFSAGELAAWRQLPLAARMQAFYRVWTKKEAFVKAVGRGIALGLEQCEVGVEEGGELLAIPGEYGSAQDWRVVELAVASGGCAALAASRREFSLRRFML